MNISKKFKVGVIGLGYGQQVHIPILKNEPRCDIVSICGTQIGKARSVAQKHRIDRYYDDWHRMLKDEDLDILTIAVPPKNQSEILKEAFKRDISCFCEKPLAANLAEALEVLEIAGNSAHLNAIDFIFPEIPTWRVVKGEIDSGKIGGLNEIEINWHVQTWASKSGIHSWKLDRSLGGGVLMSFVSHSIYYIEWLFGKIKRASCTLDESDPGKDFKASIRFLLQDDIPVRLYVNQNKPGRPSHSLSITGEKGMICLENFTHDYINGFTAKHHDSSKTQSRLEEYGNMNSETDGRLATTGSLINRWLDGLADTRGITPNIKDGLRVQYILGLLIQSSREEREVSVES